MAIKNYTTKVDVYTSVGEIQSALPRAGAMWRNWKNGGMKMPDCENCNEKCPQAEMTHEIALGRMYATKELIKLVKKVDSGQLVEVVRCKDCCCCTVMRYDYNGEIYSCRCNAFSRTVKENDFCSFGERKDNG